MTMVTRRVLFTSRTYLPDAALDNLDILRASLIHNARAGVSSSLLKARGRFYQVMEGPPHEIAGCLDRIMADRRHFEIDVLLDTCGCCRVLGESPMVFVQDPGAEMALVEEEDVGRLLERLLRLTHEGEEAAETKDAAPEDRDGD
ncbi:blue-light sensor BLUF [Roseivivax halodurans JCM 10272]|uniref:Blue-light sensor BLUF n=1 Tax=Roseivivax halodurans JCM 10272 TaxID=1449350 RepID=X7EJL3_9RHOB|nr:BLUF domain-containing protein [Roseivivax halodurans]ETX15333.1 blue-light sensor BLUF [Roseivivax halodurans JCM 10272]